MPSMRTTTVTSPAWARYLERVDWFLLACVGLMAALGTVFIAGATAGAEGLAWGPLARHLLYVLAGLAAFVAAQRIDYMVLLRHAPALYAILLVMLVGVLFTRPINGARSWFSLYVVNLQPSELLKPVLILAVAHYLMYRESYKRLTGLVTPLALFLIPMALILRQPDLGTALALVPLAFAMLYAAGAKRLHLALMTLAGCAAMVLMWFTVMKPYQKNRILAWLNPEEYRLHEAWQLLQSEIAIGSGGMWGSGMGHTQKNAWELLPEKHTDFIFAVIAEEGGFALAGLLLLLTALAALSGLGIAGRTREPAGRLIAVGVSVLLAGQALINAGVAVGLLPTTGLTYPFVSYGGSSIVSSFLCLGLLVNVGARPQVVLAKEDFA
ncbi:MAG: rod shape-determining protein RodA [Planctomycetota bacterium]|nr:rod shape-determining protein RodA [Planctomycetota bacterium]